MTRTTARSIAFATVFLLALGVVAQPRRPHRPTHTHTPAAPANAGVVVAPPSSGPELISVPVGDINRMLRQMRVWLLTPPAGATGYGLGRLGDGHRLWALLPSCRHADPDDPRDPCPVDRMVIEAVGATTSVSNMDPIGLVPGLGARRVQSFVIPAGVARVRVKLMALNNHVRYDAVVDVDHLSQLPAPTGTPTPDGFNFDLSAYPSR